MELNKVAAYFVAENCRDYLHREDLSADKCWARDSPRVRARA
jgi:hypothetical protein